MSYIEMNNAFETASVLDLITRERAMSLSTREWKHRLAGYGYAIRDTDNGPVVANLAKDHEICALPARLH